MEYYKLTKNKLSSQKVKRFYKKYYKLYKHTSIELIFEEILKDFSNESLTHELRFYETTTGRTESISLKELVYKKYMYQF